MSFGNNLLYRGLATGIYTTNTPEACWYVAENARCHIIVVENDFQLQKILAVWDRLPHLKAVVQYQGEPIQTERNVISVSASFQCTFM